MGVILKRHALSQHEIRIQFKLNDVYHVGTNYKWEQGPNGPRAHMGPGPAQGARPRFNNKARPRYNKARPRHDKARPHDKKARPRQGKARPLTYLAA